MDVGRWAVETPRRSGSDASWPCILFERAGSDKAARTGWFETDKPTPFRRRRRVAPIPMIGEGETRECPWINERVHPSADFSSAIG